jgi:hypothetical protein
LTEFYVYHRIDTAPRQWQAVAERLAEQGAERISAHGGVLYGLWRSQIGRPRDEIQAITVWPGTLRAAEAERLLLQGETDVWTRRSELLHPTLRPRDATPPVRQGNYAFRWFATPQQHWPEFLDLCAQGWPGFESAYDSQVIGLWQAVGDRTATDADEVTGAGVHAGVRSLLLTRRPDLAMWERSKIPQGKDEARVRDVLSRRYDLCDWTVVSTATLLTATDRPDKTRWT